MRKAIVVLAIVAGVVGATGTAHAAGTWDWPVVGPVVRDFDPPSSPYGSGHRGIDIAAPIGTTVVAPASGVVTFAGAVAGRLYVTLDHGGGLLSTCSFLSATLVRKGDLVVAGQPIARSGSGHVGDVIPDLHFGVRLAGEYVDPLDYLRPPSVADLIHLAPLAGTG
jgi:murein DD-endopeptidase MepM/ murein hydrolase activator NlpD